MATQQERVAQTDAAIINALVTVGKTKPLTQITISDLTRASGISRGTFYLHYLDKDDLLRHLKDYFATQLQTLLDTEMNGTMTYRDLAKGQPYPVIVDIIKLVAANKPLLEFLFGANGDPAFYRLVTTMLQTAILTELNRVKGSATFRKDLPQNYALSLVTNAIMAIVTTWLSEENGLSQEAVAKLIMQALYLSPYEMLGVQKR
ncbi:TetR/AcrR family transcriptional regulator [Secundilactobacillus similis]|uniref:TetR family transcriptional regulator n=1 Tax=Secundilactobacillus similis DSM 23365 = JCM 2765 TaxID=1423804 RepID=A0A0R2EQ04_9LACO|nr:TetR/AcrR family transcriptional regulator [Secundilactobacillus similis]KRN15973.1 TetR family transcriptional regulator [Secundilactobacillus similis DSM 23365 = JCM 2765]